MGLNRDEQLEKDSAPQEWKHRLTESGKLILKKNGQLRAEIESMEWKFKIKQRETESTKTQCKQ